MTVRVLCISLTVFFAAGCSPRNEAEKHGAAGNAAAPALAAWPVDFTVKQRSTTAVPGAGTLQVTVDDITRGQAMVAMAGNDAAVVLPVRSMKRGAAAEFKFGGETLTLTLKELSNALIGEDFARFTISRGAPVAGADPVAEEKRKITLLLDHIKNMDGATFVRNGTEHTPKEAAAHLESKLSFASEDALTARSFIDNIASKSLVSHDVYTIRLKDDSTVPVGEYLHKELAEIESQ